MLLPTRNTWGNGVFRHGMLNRSSRYNTSWQRTSPITESRSYQPSRASNLIRSLKSRIDFLLPYIDEQREAKRSGRYPRGLLQALLSSSFLLKVGMTTSHTTSSSTGTEKWSAMFASPMRRGRASQAYGETTTPLQRWMSGMPSYAS